MLSLPPSPVTACEAYAGIPVPHRVTEKCAGPAPDGSFWRVRLSAGAARTRAGSEFVLDCAGRTIWSFTLQSPSPEPEQESNQEGQTRDEAIGSEFVRLRPANLRQRADVHRIVGDRHFAPHHRRAREGPPGDDAKPSLADVVYVTRHRRSPSSALSIQKRNFCDGDSRMMRKSRMAPSLVFAACLHAAL